jgi:hypothetical protein
MEKKKVEVPSIPPISFPPQTQEPSKSRNLSKTAITIILIALIVGASIGFAVTYFVLNGRISTLQSQLNGGVQGGHLHFLS